MIPYDIPAELTWPDAMMWRAVEDHGAAGIISCNSGWSSAVLEDAVEAAVAVTAASYPPVTLGAFTIPTIQN